MFDINGRFIGTSDVIHAIVPEKNVKLKLLSEAKPEEKKSESKESKESMLSGKVYVNGEVQSEDIIDIYAREHGEKNYEKIDSCLAKGSRVWNFGNAKEGKAYDIKAFLRKKDGNISVSKISYVIAPAFDLTLVINTGLDPERPKDYPELVECLESNDKKNYEAIISYPSVEAARAYWVQIGRSKNQGDWINEAKVIKNNNTNLEINVMISKGKDYYTRYASGFCSDCTGQNSFSDFSKELKFSCGKEN
jgi:hypothetical protein